MANFFDQFPDDQPGTQTLVSPKKDFWSEFQDDPDQTKPEPQYKSLMFDTPEGAPTTDTATVRAWETPNSIVAIGKTPRNEIIPQPAPQYDTILGSQNAPLNALPPSSATQQPLTLEQVRSDQAKAVALDTAKALPGELGKSFSEFGNAVLAPVQAGAAAVGGLIQAAETSRCRRFINWRFAGYGRGPH